MTISTIVLAITGIFERGGGAGDSAFAPKDKKALKKWLNRLADALKKLAGNTIEALPATAGSVFGVIFNFLGKAVRFVAEDTRALIVFNAGLLEYGLWKVDRSKQYSSG